MTTKTKPDKMKTIDSQECLYPTFGAIRACEEFVPGNPWLVSSDEQRLILNQYHNYFKIIPELYFKASDNIEELNKILENKGFDIRLSRQDPCFGAIGILELIEEWIKSGQKAFLLIEENVYKAFLLKDGFSFDNGKIVINTLKGDLITIYPDQPIDDIYYDGVILPEIEYRNSGGLLDLIGLQYGIYMITQAMQETIFKMNYEGALLKSASAFLLVSGYGAPIKGNYFYLNSPFTIEINRPGIEIPIFKKYLDLTNFVKENIINDKKSKC